MNDNESTGLPEEKEDFAELFEKNFKELSRLEPGHMVEAAIVRISAEWIFLDVGRKGEGYLDRKELVDEAGNLTVKEGDKVRAYFLPSGGREMHFTTRIGSGPVGQAQLQNAHRSGIPVEGTVSKEVKGGFEVKISGGARAFCPFSQMGLRREEERAAYIGRSFTFQITECGDRNVVLSRKSFVEVERKEKAQALKETLKEGMRLKGKVTSIQKFGAFIDIGGLEGLLPVSEIAWGRTENVSDVLKVGQELEVVLKKLDWENERLSFSIKDALPDPWLAAEQTWPVGSYQEGTVTRLAPFGAFVALGSGVEGLIHISKMSAERRLNHPREVLKEGQAVEVRVEAVDRESRKLSLSLAELSRAQEEEQADVQAYLQKSSSASQNLGTFADLLRAKQERDKKK
jgi:small subunit ribosomal protein S1